MAAISSYEMFDEGKILNDYGKSGFNFENCRRYVIYFNEIFESDLCVVTLQKKRNLNPHTKSEFIYNISFISFSNEMLIKNGFKEPKSIKTGTTIVGIVFKDGVVLGADTRATEGPIVADKNCEKIHFLAKNM